MPATDTGTPPLTPAQVLARKRDGLAIATGAALADRSGRPAAVRAGSLIGQATADCRRGLVSEGMMRAPSRLSWLLASTPLGPLTDPTPVHPAESGAGAGLPADLFTAALAARDKAYAPYSQFRVGAALRLADGRIVPGANVENASYGLGLCAERAALIAAVVLGEPPRSFGGLVVVGDTGSPIAPCGACRQVMLELGGPAMPVWLTNLRGAVRATTPQDLLPDAFSPSDLE
jgi:cytidine deaminase